MKIITEKERQQLLQATDRRPPGSRIPVPKQSEQTLPMEIYLAQVEQFSKIMPNTQKFTPIQGSYWAL